MRVTVVVIIVYIKKLRLASRYKALKRIGIRPAVIQLNETATIFAAIARLDELCRNGMNIYEAVVYVRKHTLYTNHTLVQAAESVFQFEQFERYVFPNISSLAVRHWIVEQFEDGKLRLSTLAIELTEAKNGVSRLHARVCDFKDSSGERVKFHAVTNGIDLETWCCQKFWKFYFDKGIIDKFGLVTAESLERVLSSTAQELRALNEKLEKQLTISSRIAKIKYGNPLQLPEDALVFDFKRRFADYKRIA